MKMMFPVLLSAAAMACQAAEIVPLTSLDLSNMRQGYGRPQIDRSIRQTPLSIGGRKFEHGVGSHANSTLWIDLSGGSERFLASVGVDDAAGGPASITFKIVGDGKKLWESGLMKPGQAPKQVDIDLKGVQKLVLLVGDGGDGIGYDHADWVEARFVVSGAQPKTMDSTPPKEEAVVLTPKPGPGPGSMARACMAAGRAIRFSFASPRLARGRSPFRRKACPPADPRFRHRDH